MTELRLHVDEPTARIEQDTYRFPDHLASRPVSRIGTWRPVGPLPSSYRLDGTAVRNDPLIADVERMLEHAERQLLHLRDLVDEEARAGSGGEDDRPKAA